MASWDVPAPPPVAPAEESSLVERARGGDTEAFRALVEKYQDRVFALARRMVGDREEAEEVAQDAFLRAWRALPRFRADARFSTWLYRIAYRRACDAAASLGGRRHRERGLEMAESIADPAPAAGPSGGEELERLVASLPEAQRAAITLFYYQDRSLGEVARILGLPEGTVKTHLHRARAALRRALQRGEARERGHGLHRV